MQETSHREPSDPVLKIFRNAGNVVATRELTHLVEAPMFSGANKRDGRIIQTA